jgi:hypothetical protein
VTGVTGALTRIRPGQPVLVDARPVRVIALELDGADSRDELGLAQRLTQRLGRCISSVVDIG